MSGRARGRSPLAKVRLGALVRGHFPPSLCGVLEAVVVDPTTASRDDPERRRQEVGEDSGVDAGAPSVLALVLVLVLVYLQPSSFSNVVVSKCS
jgi:hypothetical protein